MATNRVRIVILNYLNYQDTLECINSALNLSYSPLFIVVVDNGSNNESDELVLKKFKSKPSVTILKSKANLGFARGNNLGIEYARKKLKFDFVFVANNDTVCY